MARSSLVRPSPPGVAHRARDVEHEQHPRVLAQLGPRVEDPDEHVRRRHLELGRRLLGVDAVGGDDRLRHWDRRVVRTEPEVEHLLLILGTLDVLLEQRRRGLLVRVDPRGLEDDERVVGEERSLLRIDRDQRITGRPGLLARREHAVGVAQVVVDHALLLDGDRTRVGERGAPHVGGEPVVEERHRDVAVVHDGGLDLGGEVDGRRPGEILGREIGRLAGRRVVLGDGEVEPARGVVGVGLAQPERAPLRMAHSGPSLGVLGQRGQVGEADGLVRPAEGLGHRPGHGDDQRREHERGAGRGQDLPGPLVHDRRPPGRGGRPDHRRLAVDLRIGPPVDDQVRRVPRRHAARADEHAPITDRGLVAVVEVLGELGQQGDLLAAHGHVDDDAVSWVGAGEVARVRFGTVVVVAGARGRSSTAAAAAATTLRTGRDFATSGTIPAQMPGWQESRPDGGAHWISSQSSAGRSSWSPTGAVSWPPRRGPSRRLEVRRPRPGARSSGTSAPSGAASTACSHMDGSG